MSDNQSDNAPDWDLTLRNAARRSAKIIYPEPDCRTCANHGKNYYENDTCTLAYDPCTNGNRYKPLPPVRLWRSP